MLRSLIFCCLALLLSKAFAEENGATAEWQLKNTIQWSTASEVNNFGYDVYRGEAENGPFIKLTKTSLPAAGTVDTPQFYKFVDDTIAPDTVYYYYVESISMDGVRERLTPIVSSQPKSWPDG
jgi:hypothetical protein